jgi:precorrin-2 dehydrogenase / sirohydrochlorin ferrochelatase
MIDPGDVGDVGDVGDDGDVDDAAMTAPYPVNLVVAARPCLVVGAGPVGARKAEGLAACGARVTLVAPALAAEADRLVTSGVVAVERRRYRSGEAADYWLVVTATDDPAVNQAVYDDAVAAGVWVNSADDPARCTFTLPAVHRQRPVLVTASTGGASPALACWLRDLLASHVGPELADLADRLAAERARVHAGGGSTEGRDWTDVIEAELERLRTPGPEPHP